MVLPCCSLFERVGELFLREGSEIIKIIDRFNTKSKVYPPMQIYFLVYLLPKILTSKLSYMVYAMVLPEGAMVTSILPLGSQWPSLQANWSTRSPGCPAPESADVWLNTPESFGHGITVSVVPFVAYTQTAHPHPTPTPPPPPPASLSQFLSMSL